MLLHDWYQGMAAQPIIPLYVINSKVSPRALRLYCIYAAICQQGNGICWDSISSLCRKAHLSRQGVIDSRRELEHFGFIEVRRPKPMFGSNCHVEVSLRHPTEEQVEPWTGSRPDSPYEERRHGTRRKKAEEGASQSKATSGDS